MDEDPKKPDKPEEPDKKVDDPKVKDEDVEIVEVLPEAKRKRKPDRLDDSVVVNEDVIVIPDSPEPPKKKILNTACKSKIIDNSGVKGKSLVVNQKNQSVKSLSAVAPVKIVCHDSTYSCSSRVRSSSSSCGNAGVSTVPVSTEVAVTKEAGGEQQALPLEGNSSEEPKQPVNQPNDAARNAGSNSLSPAETENNTPSSRYLRSSMALLDLIIDEENKETQTKQNEAGVSSTESSSSAESASRPTFRLRLTVSKQNEDEAIVSSTKVCGSENLSGLIDSVWVGNRIPYRGESSGCRRTYGKPVSSPDRVLGEANVSSTRSVSSPESDSKDSVGLIDLLVANEIKESKSTANRLPSVSSSESPPESATEATEELSVGENKGTRSERRESSMSSTRSVGEDREFPKSNSKGSTSTDDSKDALFFEAESAGTSSRLLSMVQPMSSDSTHSKESTSLDHTYCGENSERDNQPSILSSLDHTHCEHNARNPNSLSYRLLETQQPSLNESMNSESNVPNDHIYCEENLENVDNNQSHSSTFTSRLLGNEVPVQSMNPTANEANGSQAESKTRPSTPRLLESGNTSGGTVAPLNQTQSKQNGGTAYHSERNSSNSSASHVGSEQAASAESNHSAASTATVNETGDEEDEETEPVNQRINGHRNGLLLIHSEQPKYNSDASSESTDQLLVVNHLMELDDSSSVNSTRPEDYDEVPTEPSSENEEETRGEQSASNAFVLAAFAVEQTSSRGSAKSDSMDSQATTVLRRRSSDSRSNESMLTHNSGEVVDVRFFESDGFLVPENGSMREENYVYAGNNMDDSKRFIIYGPNLSDSSSDEENYDV